jgi:hypothetical protein
LAIDLVGVCVNTVNTVNDVRKVAAARRRSKAPNPMTIALVPAMISEKSSTLFAKANFRLTRSQRRGI